MKLLLPEFGLLIWTLVAFLVVFFILKKFAWPAIVKGLADREKSIADSLSTAERVRQEMMQLKSDNEALLVKAREERALLIRDAKEVSDKMITEAKDKARTEYDRIVSDAQSTINQQKMAAITDLKNQVGNLVIEISEKVLRRELGNKTEQEKYIKELADEVKLN